MKEKTHFVAREHELVQLGRFLGQAKKGKGQVCFAIGEAGTGKTALVTEFSRQAVRKHQDLVVVYGQCNAITGSSDPYLPFREILQQLTGDVAEELAQDIMTQVNANRLRYLLSISGRALVEAGPDLIGMFVPGAGLVARLAAFAFDESEWGKKLRNMVEKQRHQVKITHLEIKPNQIFEQYTNTLLRLSVNFVILLILEDLQWVDIDSVGLLFHLIRRIDGNRIMILGTYRPAEIDMGRATVSAQVESHPLKQPLSEFKRYHGDVFVELEQTQVAGRRRFVDALLDTEPNRLGKRFRQMLLMQTNGHPLFTIELLRGMQERGDLVKDKQGYWVEGPVLNWQRLPTRVEGAIEVRINRLGDELRNVLIVGSVEGESFTAQVIAHVLSIDSGRITSLLGNDLEKRHKLVRYYGKFQIKGKRLSLYRFSHNLFQVYLYNELNEDQKANLHKDVGNGLESLYGDQSDEIAVQLMHHFERAGILDKASHYLYEAGQQAVRKFANAQALHYFDRALELTNQEDMDNHFKIQLARENVQGLQGARTKQAQTIASLEILAGQLDSQYETTWHQAQVSLRQARYAEWTGDFTTAAHHAQQAVGLAKEAYVSASESYIPSPSELESLAYLRWGVALREQGLIRESKLRLEQALTRTGGLPHLEADILKNLGNVTKDLGEYSTAREIFSQALDLYRQIGDLHGEAKLIHALGSLHYRQSDFSQFRNYSDQALAIYRKIGDLRSESRILNNLGTIAYLDGKFSEASRHYENALYIAKQVDDLSTEAILLTNLGVIADDQGNYPRAKRYYQEALAIYRGNGDRKGEATGLINLGCVAQNLGSFSKARSYFEQALDIQNQIGAVEEELDALNKLGGIAAMQESQEEARDFFEQARQTSRKIGNRNCEGAALIGLGNAWLKLGQLDLAEAAFQDAAKLRQQSGQGHLVMDSLDGLARMSMYKEMPTQALGYVELILSFLEKHTLEGTMEPLRIYLTCIQVLQLAQDPRATAVLESAYRLLQERVDNIEDKDTRQIFLENIPWHREIMELWEANQT